MFSFSYDISPATWNVNFLHFRGRCVSVSATSKNYHPSNQCGKTSAAVGLLKKLFNFPTNRKNFAGDIRSAHRYYADFISTQSVITDARHRTTLNETPKSCLYMLSQICFRY